MEQFNVQNVADKIMEKLKEEYKKLTRLNVMVVGKTGVGKSTLINALFNEELSKTGIGRPITQNIRKLEKPDFPLAIYDTPGLELSGDNSLNDLLNEIKSEIDKCNRTGRIEDMIHCIWYCISTTSHRIETTEIEFIKNFATENSRYNIPIIIVLTKSFNKGEALALQKIIEQEYLPIISVIPVLAKDYLLNEEYTIKSYGLKDLADLMYEVIPEEVQKTFVSIQMANTNLKKKRAQAIISSAAITAAGIGATPIPLADASLLVPNQIAMIASITAIFGLPIKRSSMVAIISATLGTSAATILGRSVVANFFKLIPGAGSVAGGAISAGTAAAITAALGESYLALMLMVMQGELNMEELSSKKGKNIIQSIFKQKLQIKRKKPTQKSLKNNQPYPDPSSTSNPSKDFNQNIELSDEDYRLFDDEDIAD